MSALPASLRVEVKFTTGAGISVPVRELLGVESSHKGSAPLIAVLHMCGDREVDGRWIVVDVRDTGRSSNANSTSFSMRELRRLERQQKELDVLRTQFVTDWPRLLFALMEEALCGHDALMAVFERCRQRGGLRERLREEPVLDSEHAENLRRLLEKHGEQSMGRIMQDLFAFLLILAGYQGVTINPVGVPDVEAQLPFGDEHVVFTPDELRRLADYCERAGDRNLSERIRAHLNGLTE